MRSATVAGIAVLTIALVSGSFSVGRVSERRAQQRSVLRSQQHARAIGGSAAKSNRLLPNDLNQNDHLLVANVASVSFGELWDVMRAGTPGKLMQWAKEIEQLPPGPRRNAALKSFCKIWVELDPDAAIEGVEKITDKRMRIMAFYAAADAAADSALPAFAELERRLGYRTNSFSSTAILSRWAAVDPLAVAHFLEAHPQSNAGFFMDVTYNWANSDPEKAAAWFTNLALPPMNDPRYPRAEDRRRLEAARGLLESWLDKDSQGAATFVAIHADDPDIKTALGEFTGALFTKSHDQAAAFISSLPNEDAKHAALAEISKYIGGRVIMLKEGGDDEEPEEPDIPAEDVPPWLVTLPQNLWIDHVGEILESWDKADSPKAEAWLGSLPPAVKSKAIVDYCGAASAEEASRIFDLTRFIDDGSVRGRLAKIRR